MRSKNIITATIEFYFKGKKFSPSLTLELDPFMQSNSGIPDLYQLIAAENNIDLYSYEYEILQAEPVLISAAQGLVANYIHDGMLDNTAFEQAWREQQVKMTIQQIIERHGLNTVIRQYPALEAALLDVFAAGQESQGSETI